LKRKIWKIGLKNRQHGNKPYFTGVSLSFSAGNTAATGGNMLLHSVASLRKMAKFAHLFQSSVDSTP
jgi:hypothetical protein